MCLVFIPVVLSSWKRPVSSLPTFYPEFITRDSSTTWTPEFGKQTPALVTPVRQSIANVLGSHRVSSSQTNALFVQLSCSFDAATRQSNLSASWRSFSAVRRKKRREPSRVYYDEHSSSESSTWTTCRTTSERRELCRGLHTHRRHQQRVKTGGILCKKNVFSTRPVRLGQSLLPLPPCLINELTGSNTHVPVKLRFWGQWSMQRRAEGQEMYFNDLFPRLHFRDIV